MHRMIIAAALSSLLVFLVVPLVTFRQHIRIPENLQFKARFGGLAPFVCRDRAIRNHYLVNISPHYPLEKHIHIHGWHHPITLWRENWYKVLIFTEDGVDAIRADPAVKVVQCVAEYETDGQPIISAESLAITGPASDHQYKEAHHAGEVGEEEVEDGSEVEE